jgi:sec-independent protein translocase protein TatA
MDIGAPELLIVLFIVVLLFGPGRLAGLGAELGKGIRSFKQGLNPEADHPVEASAVSDDSSTAAGAHHS